MPLLLLFYFYLVLQGPVTCDSGLCWDSSDIPGCPDPHGDAVQQAAHDLNVFKNNVAVPDAGRVKPVTMVDLLWEGDDTTRFVQGDPASLEAYVLDVKVGGVESCNCHARSPLLRDTHIELGITADPSTRHTQRVIVEITPHTRKLKGVFGGGLSTARLRALLIGKRVRVTGWLLFDVEHKAQAENTNPGNPTNWRATCWEIHPVTGGEVLP